MEILEIFRYKKLFLEKYDYITVMILYLFLCSFVSIINIMIVNFISKYINEKNIKDILIAKSTYKG
ncbi:hypothetical protein LAD12857_03720 [Lacrimispora amygdalina]|uniref:Uncharacterized protein n=1 Tax=Lacrimispora amygdalina TaxID=253257 RepID=A0ABQ5M0G8_9FIRM